MSKDLNFDGQLNLDGFKSSVIGASELSEYKITLQELTEILEHFFLGEVRVLVDCLHTSTSYIM